MHLNYNESQCYPRHYGETSELCTEPRTVPQSRHSVADYPYVNEKINEETYMKNDSVPPILSSQQKANFLKKCCASPILRFILHLLSDPSKETLCSWYGGPFGVKIWNTRKFTESYNAAMGTNLNFTNISRALQACEHITLAAIRLWKRIKQGEYSFFPGYTGHGVPQIPLSAMPRDVPAHFPFERQGTVKCSQPRPSRAYGETIMNNQLPSFPAPYYNQISYSTPPPVHRSHPIRFNPYPSPCSTLSPSQVLSPPASVSPQMQSPEMTPYSTESSGYLSIPCSILTPSPSDTSSAFSESFSLNDSVLSHPHSAVFEEQSYSFAVEASPAVAQEFVEEAAPLKSNIVQNYLDTPEVDEFLARVEQSSLPSSPPVPSYTPPVAVTSEQEVIPFSSPKDISSIDEQDIFGNSFSMCGYDLSIDETSLLYH